jgi:hypothetical protein
MVVTFLTRAPSEPHIKAFMQRIRPLGWWPAELNVHQGDNRQLKWLSLNWVAMISFIIASLFGLGKLILLEFQAATVYLSIAILSALALRVFLKKTNIFGRN